MNFAVIPEFVFLLAEARVARQEATLGATRPQPFLPPVFVPKQPIPKLTSYTGLFPDSYWSTWPFNGLKNTPDPWISPYKLFSTAMAYDYPDLKEVCHMCTWLAEGAPVGAQGAARLPAIGKNLKGMEVHGFEGNIVFRKIFKVYSQLS